MSRHPAFSQGNVAVVTGAADGIGLAAAKQFHQWGMRVVMVDLAATKLSASAAEIGDVLAIPADVADKDQLDALRERVYRELGQVDVLMNNAGISRANSCWDNYDHWQAILDVNLWGVINGVQAFAQAMVQQGTPGLIINTGSKQGITTPPGNPAYNVSKAGVKAFTEALQHQLRNTENCQVSAHLLVPGFTFTAINRGDRTEKPPAAWTPEQVIDFMTEAVTRGDFYILCPDNDVDRETDNKRMAWAMGDLIENRPPLSRWHPDYADAFAAHMGRKD